MPFCEHCGDEISYLPFKCKYCGGIFCKKHRLPENHECSFELKHTPLVPSTKRAERPRYQDTVKKTPSYRSYERKQEKKYLKPQRKPRKRTYRGYSSPYSSTSGQFQGTKFLVVMILIFTIASLFIGIQPFILLSGASISSLFIWTFFTSLFVVLTGGIIGVLFLFIQLFFFYMVAKGVEAMFGTKLLFRLYTICGLFTALIYILFRLLFAFLEPDLFPLNYIIFPIGLASSAMLGVIAFRIYLNPDAEWMILLFFIPVKMKGNSIIIFNVIQVVLFSFFASLTVGIYSMYFFLFLIVTQLAGIPAAYLFLQYRMKKKRY